MDINYFSFLLCFTFFTSSFIVHSKTITGSSSLYLSPTILFPNYQKMLEAFKIYMYTPPKPFSFTSPVESLFFSSLSNSPFVTQDPEEAHLFFVPLSANLSTRTIARVIRELRMEFPYWNRTLGADHFYVSCQGLGYESDRNLVELKKNSVQISCFPAPEGKFVPHKDITMPPLAFAHSTQVPANRTVKYRGFVKHNGVKESALVNDLRSASDFFMENQPSDEKTFVDRLANSEFCLFEYGADVSGIADALRFGCVPVVITGRPIQDLPLMDVMRWQEIAVFVGYKSNGVLDLEALKGVLDRTCKGYTCEGKRRLGVAASKHLLWNETPEPLDPFHMIMYQLWLRRHTIRYAEREWV